MLTTDRVEIVSSEPLTPESIIVNWSELVTQAHRAIIQYLVQEHAAQASASLVLRYHQKRNPCCFLLNAGFQPLKETSCL